MLKIALITNYNFAEKANAAMAVADRLIREGGEVLIAAFNREKLVRTHRHRPEFRYLPIDPLYAEADIVIVAAGRAGVVGADYVREGQTIIDVGINVNAEGKLCGDVDYAAVEPIVDAITPVPGGVGSVTTSVLVGHVVEAAMRKAQ